MSAWRHPAWHWAIGLALGAVLIYASIDKIEQPREFARIVYHYQMLGPSARLGYLPANLFSVALPWVEVVTGVLLVTGLWRREAALVAALLMSVFLAAVSWALFQGIDIQNCGCFSVGPEGRAAGWRLLLGDLALLAGALFLVLVPPRSTEPALDPMASAAAH